LEEVAAFAQVFTYTGLVETIQDEVRFARVRFGQNTDSRIRSKGAS
jgi:hypothetical protein